MLTDELINEQLLDCINEPVRVRGIVPERRALSRVFPLDRSLDIEKLAWDVRNEIGPCSKITDVEVSYTISTEGVEEALTVTWDEYPNDPLERWEQ